MRELFEKLEEFRVAQGIHPDDFDNLFVSELIEMSEEGDE